MAKVTNLAIKRQTGSKNLVATWDFDSTHKTVTYTSAAIKVGSWVKIKSGARYYNGASIPSWVMSDTWKVIQIDGDRVVIHQNPSGTHAIMSAISASYLTSTESGGSSTTVTYDTVENYTVSWYYDSGDSIWFDGSVKQTTTNKYHTYSMPDNALRIKCVVTPNSKTRKVNNQDTPYWSGEAVEKTIYYYETAPDDPSTPTVTIDGYQLKAQITGIDDGRADYIDFEVYDNQTYFKKLSTSVEAQMAVAQCTVNAGGSYRVRAQAKHWMGNNSFLYSGWSAFSSAVLAIPAAPSGITSIKGSSSTSVYLEWAKVNSAETYTIQYTTKLSYFDASSEVKSVSGIEGTHYEVTGLETGEQYFFRVCAVNSQGESAYCDPKTVTIGKKPSAPTTWSSTTTVVTGTPLNLYWVHNATDGSSETYAEVETTIGGVTETHTIKNDTTDEDTKDKTKCYAIDTTSYKEGTSIKWRVRTAGITKEYGSWSVMRTVDVYAPPTLSLSVRNQDGDPITVATSFPFYIKGVPGPATQAPLGYHVEITANSGYETVDSVGRDLTVNAGDAVYSKQVDTGEALLIELSPSNIDLQNGTAYTVSVIASMNSGLSVEEQTEFEVSWEDETYDLDAEVSIDKTSYVAYISPYARYITAEGEDEPTTVPDVWLSVYRREFDGTYQLIADKVDSQSNTTVTDPHPALDYARYRIVATAKDTGAITYYDTPSIPVGGDGIVIQWDEAWSAFDIKDENAVRAEQQWAGSLLKLPYNIDVQDSVSTDSELVNYIGRTYPVSYYGTAVDSTSSWSTDLVKTDTESLYALRRLSVYKGDVYVREPSGTGYWAKVDVSISQSYSDAIIPVTLSITRVEGGM